MKDWDIQINYGIKTGYNDAFIISTEKRNEILANCKTEEERRKTEELIRPILRGRDIKRYGYEWADLWLINTHNGVKGRIPRVRIEDYPAVKAHLDQFWDKIKDRADQGDTPYNLRNCAYLDLFFQPKICWKAVGRNLTFAIVDSGIFLTAPASFISAGGSNKYLLAFLCSAIGKYYIYKNSDTTGAGDIMLNIQSLIRFPIPKIKISDMRLIENMIDQISEKYDPMLQSTIDSKIFSLYGFDKDEIKVINDV